MNDRDKKKFLYYYEQGLLDTEIAKAMRVAKSTVFRWRQALKLPNNYDQGRDIQRSSSATLCWQCRKACGGCSWTSWDFKRERPRFEPVEGWEAVPRMLYAADKARGGVQSYEVRHCPEFKPDQNVRRAPQAKGDPCQTCRMKEVCRDRRWTCNAKARWEEKHG